MELEDLNAHLQLLQTREELTELLDRLYSKAAPGAQRLDGMPHGSGPADKVGDLATEIIFVKASIDELQEEIQQSETRIKAFIGTIPNAKTQLLFTLRFIRGLQWKEVADIMGKYQTVGNVSRMCYQYLEKQEHRKEGEP